MKQPLLYTLLAQMLFFSGWGGWLLYADRGAREVWLETQPVDPRDYLAGHFVALTYRIANPEAPGCREILDSNRDHMIFVRLVESGQVVATVDGPKTVWNAAECRRDYPPQTDEKWVQGFVKRSWGRAQVEYGIERYYVNEGDPLREARSGTVVAKVNVQRNRNLRITKLVKLEGK